MMRPVPDSLAEDAKTMSIRAMKRKHGVGYDQMLDWLTQIGAKAARITIGRPAITLDDIADKAKVMSLTQLSEHYGVHRITIRRELHRHGISALPRWKAHTVRPRTTIPDDFAQIAPTMTIAGLMAHYGHGYMLIKQWLTASGIKPLVISGRQPQALVVPEGWDEFAPIETNYRLAERFGLTPRRIAKLRKHTGIMLKRPEKPVKEPRERSADFARQPAPRRVWKHVGQKASPLPQRDDSELGRAADHLRRVGWIVTRRRADGCFDPKGEFYRVGSMPLMSAADMLAMSVRKGFQRIVIYGEVA